MKQQLISFYEKQFFKIKSMHPRHSILAIALLICKEVQLLSILLGNSITNEYQSFLAFQSAIRFTKLYTLVCWDTNNKECLIYFQFWIAGILMLLTLILCYIIWHQQQQSTSDNDTSGLFINEGNKQKQIKQIYISKYYHGENDLQQEMDYRFIYYLKMVLSVFLQIFEYLFFQSFLYLTLNNQVYSFQQYNESHNPLHLIAILLGFLIIPLLGLIYFFTAFHKSSYRFFDEDQLGTLTNKQNHLIIGMCMLVVIIQVICQELGQNSVTKFFAIIYYLFQLFIGLQYKFYQNKDFQLLQNYLCIQILLIIIIYTYQELGSSNESNLIQFYIFIGPLFGLITKIISNNHHRQVILFQKNQNINGQTLDWQLRSIFWHSRQIFVNKRDSFNQTKRQIYYSLLLYNVVSNHLNNCDGKSEIKNKISDCFCKQYFIESNVDEEQKSWNKHVQPQGSQMDESKLINQDGLQLNEKWFQHFLMDYIKDQYEIFLKKRQIQSIEVSLAYVYFIIEVLKIPTKAFVEALNLNKISKYKSLKNKMLIYSLLSTSKIKFHEFIARKQLLHQKFNLQICFQLDKSFLIVSNNICCTIQQIRNWLELLINQRDNLMEIQKQGQEILKNSEIIEDQLNKMFIANPLSLEIEQMYAFYFKYINIHSKRNSLYKKNSKLANEFVLSYNKFPFNKDCCVVNITLLQPLGKITRFTNSFVKFSGVKDRCELYTSVTMFMPDVIARYHSQYLMNFIEKGRLHYINTEQRFLLVKTKEQFIVPVYAKIKLEDSYDDDFGASAIITKIVTPYHYILLNEYCLLEEISQSIYVVFQSLLNCSVAQLKSIDFLLLIPQLLSHWENFTEDNQNLIQTKQSSQNISFSQSNSEFLLIVPQNAKSIEQVLSKRKPSKKKLARYLYIHKQELLDFFENLEDFHLFNLKIKIVPIHTINQNVYILEIQSIKQFRKMSGEEKQERLKQVINQIFPYQMNPISDYVKQSKKYIETMNQFKNIDIANLDEIIFQEEDQMGEILSQNVSKVLKTNTNSQRNKLLSLQNLLTGQQCVTSGQISFSEIPSFPLFTQNQNAINHDKESITDDFSESSVPINNDGNNIEIKENINSMSSATKYQDQFAKRSIIKKVIFEKQSEQNFKTLFFLWKIVFLSILVLCTTIFTMLIQLENNSKEFSGLLDFGQQSEAQNLFILYNQCEFDYDLIDCKQQTSDLFFNLSQSLSKMTSQISALNIQSCNIFYQIGSPFDKDQINLKMELTYLYNLMHNIIYDNNDESNKQYILSYYCYQQLFAQIDLTLEDTYRLQLTGNENLLHIGYIIGIICILIFCILSIPFELYKEKEKIKILKLFQTFNQQQLSNQLILYQNLVDANQKLDQTSRDYFLEDILDTSKSKFEMMESKHLVKRSFDTKTQNKNTKFFVKTSIVKQSFINIPLKFMALLCVVMMLQSYFIISYLIYIDQINTIESNFTSILAFNSLRSKFLLIAGEISLITTHELQENKDFQNLFVTKVEQDQLNVFNSEQNQWQQLVKQIAEDNNLLSFTTQNFCEIFPLQSDSEFTYQTCSNIDSLQTGFIIVITSVGHFFEQIISSLSNGLITDQTLLLVDNSKYVIQTKCIFIIKALDILKNIQASLDIDGSQYFQIIIYAVYVSLIVVIHICGKYYVKVQIFETLEQSKKLLSLIPMELLLDNSYVMSFILTEQMKMQL